MMKNFFATITIILLTFSLFAQSPNPRNSHPELDSGSPASPISHPELDSGSPASPTSHPDSTKSHPELDSGSPASPKSHPESHPELDSGSPDTPISHPDSPISHPESHPDSPKSHPELDSGSPVIPQDVFPTEDLYNNPPEKSTSSGKLRPKDNTTVVDEADDIELTGVEKKKNEQDRKNIRNNAEESRSIMLRSNELNKKIEKNKIALLQKSLLLTNNFAEDEVLNLIGEAENLKAEILRRRNQLVKEQEATRLRMEEELNKNIQQLQDSPYAIAEMDASGKPLERAQEDRLHKIQQLQSENKSAFSRYVNDSEQELKEQEKPIIEKIEKINLQLEKKRSINSVFYPKTEDRPSMVTAATYDGVNFGWEMNIFFTLGNHQIEDYNIFVPYKKVTGKKPNYKSAAYKNTVEEYDSYFRTAVPAIYAVVDFTVQAAPSYMPSRYLVRIEKTTLYLLEDNKKVLTQFEKNLVGTYSFLPVNDIRTDAEKRRDKIAVTQLKINSERQQEKDRKYAQKHVENSGFYNFVSPALRCGIEAGFKTPVGLDLSKLNWYGAFDIPFKPVFVGAEITINDLLLNFKDKDKPLIDLENTTYDIAGRLGYQMKMWGQAFSPFVMAGFGAQFNNEFTQSTFFVNGTAGLHLLYTLNIFYNFNYNFNLKQAASSIGVSLSLNGPWGK